MSMFDEVFQNLLSKKSRIVDVHLKNMNANIHTLIVNDKGFNKPVVLIHGFMGGMWLWINVINTLSKNHTVYVIDLLGFGLSSRYEFPSKMFEIEKTYVDSLEEWRIVTGINSKFYLVGHSFGGFISVIYSLRYSECIEKLILVEPWGFSVPRTNLPRAYSVLESALIWVDIFGILMSDWGQKIFMNISPQFSHTIFGENQLIYEYLKEINSIKPSSGQKAFVNLSYYFGRYCKKPITERLEEFDNKTFNIWFIYGDSSWMSFYEAFNFIELEKSRRREKTKLKLFNGPLDQLPEAEQDKYLTILDKGGHHLQFTCIEQFNSLLFKIINNLI